MEGWRIPGTLSEGLPVDGVLCRRRVCQRVYRRLRPDFLIGDWDSGSRPELDVPCMTLPVEKDMTDLQAAMDEALSMGISRLLLCGCTGGRLDHTMSNLLLLEWLADRGGEGMIVDEDNEVRLLRPGSTRFEDDPHYHYLSLAPLDHKYQALR